MAAGVNMTDVYAEYRAKYEDLKAQVDSRKADVEETQKKLDEVNAAIEKLRLVQQSLVERKSKILGGQSYIDLKKHIAALAKLLSGK